MPRVFTSEKQKIGKLGEDIACKFLVKHGFKIVCQNYTKKWGELDIVTEKGKRLHFIEVKSVVGEESDHRPEENIHPWKVKRILRAVQTYLLEKRVDEETEWQIDVMAVFLNLNDRRARVRVIENAIN